MNYTRLLAALGVLCLLAVPALSAQYGNGPSNKANQDNKCFMNCIGNGPGAGAGCPQNCNENGCQNEKACKLGLQDGTGIQNGNGQNGNQQGAKDGSGPKRDCNCGNCNR